MLLRYNYRIQDNAKSIIVADDDLIFLLLFCSGNIRPDIACKSSSR